MRMRTFFRGSLGTFLGLTVVTLWTAPAFGTLLLNEIYVNPPGSDANNEYVEVLSTTGLDSLDGVWLLEIDGDGSQAGTVDLARNLTGLSLGANGLLTLGEGYALSNPWGITDPPTGLASLERTPNATLENGSISFLLVTEFTETVGVDLDADNDGTLDFTPWGSVLDGIGWTDGGSGDLVYAPVFTSVSGTPDAASRIFGDATANSAAAWWGGDILSTDINDPNLSTLYDLATVGNAENRTANRITPGLENVPEPTAAVWTAVGLLAGFLARRR